MLDKRFIFIGVIVIAIIGSLAIYYSDVWWVASSVLVLPFLRKTKSPPTQPVISATEPIDEALDRVLASAAESAANREELDDAKADIKASVAAADPKTLARMGDDLFGDRS